MFPAKIVALIELTFDSDPNIALRALVKLSQMDHPSALEALEGLTKWGPTKAVRADASWLLEQRQAGAIVLETEATPTPAPTAEKTQVAQPTKSTVPSLLDRLYPPAQRHTTRSQRTLSRRSAPSKPTATAPHRFPSPPVSVVPPNPDTGPVLAIPPRVAPLDITVPERYLIPPKVEEVPETVAAPKEAAKPKIGGMLLNTVTDYVSSRKASVQEKRANLIWALWFACLMAFSTFLGLNMRTTTPSPSMIAWLMYLTGVVAIFFRPRYGIYLTVGFALVADAALIPWYPFTKNFSSGESLLFLSNAVIISPLESYLVLTLVVWLGKGFIQRKLHIYRSDLFWPVLAFAVFIVIGLVHGVLTGGNTNIALWESRAILYLPIMLIATNNLLVKREHVSHLFWFAMIALFIEGITGFWFVAAELQFDLGSVQAITEHSAAIHMNTLFIFIASVWLYRGSLNKRIFLPLFIPPVLLTYVATQRRSAFLTLGIALILMAGMMYKVNRRLFWLLVPPLALIATVYIAAFWNNTGALGLPAQAVKSVVAEDESNAADQSSNIYRMIENINSDFTIHQAPLLGVGFGKKFYIIAPMPDISFFDWWEYITHNSIIWIWMKTGFGGFFTMVFLIGLAITTGVRSIWRMPGGDLSAMALTATLYIIMHFVYAYVDMSWDTQSMLYVGVMMGIISTLERIVAQPVHHPPKRWHWQADPPPVPGLVPLPNIK